MNYILSILLTLSIMVDLGSPTAVESESYAAQSFSMHCEKVDMHHAQDHKQVDDHSSQHCHCHLGHIHLAVLSQTIAPVTPDPIKQDYSFPIITEDHTNKFHSQLIKPPIA